MRPMNAENQQSVKDDTEWVSVIEVRAVKPKPKKPPLYRVSLLNDDYTPMEFVVYVLQRFFQMNAKDAQRLMLQVHTKGQAVCGIFSREIAETKVNNVNLCSRENQHPLLCTMEPETHHAR